MYLFKKFIYGLLFVISVPTSVNANIIHWELSSQPLPFIDGYVTGGFDFNTVTNEISKITVESFASSLGFCLECNNFNGGVGRYFSFPDGYSRVEFSETFINNNVIDRDFFLAVSSQNTDGIITPFNLKIPGSYNNLLFQERGYLRLDDPLDPDVFSQDDCPSCASAIGTIVAAPEPSTYILMLTGLVIIAWSQKYKHTVKKVNKINIPANNFSLDITRRL